MEGKYFEELEIGREFTTRSRTVTETDIVYYAGLSWDHNPEHTDVEFAKGTVFKERVAHMLLSLVFANGLSASTGFLRGTPREATEVVASYARAGTYRVNIALREGPYDWDGLEAFASDVMPQFR